MQWQTHISVELLGIKFSKAKKLELINCLVLDAFNLKIFFTAQFTSFWKKCLSNNFLQIADNDFVEKNRLNS